MRSTALYVFVLIFLASACTPIFAKDDPKNKDNELANVTASAAAQAEVDKKQEAQNADPVVPLMQPNEYDKIVETRYSLFPHKGTFVLPFTYNWNPHEDLYQSITQQPGQPTDPYYDKTELEMQISFMIPVVRKIRGTNWDLTFAYTHHSWWQLYNSSWSKPFRETNYLPELFGRYIFEKPRKLVRFRVFAADVGIAHQSNGQISDLSRSWDRLIGRLYFKSPYVFMVVSGWYRVPEGSDDDNANISRYMGHGEMELYKLWSQHSWSLKVPFAERPGVELRYSYPWKNSLRWFVNYKTGYGHSLIEYNRYTDRIGVGIALESFLDSPELNSKND